MKAFSLTAVQTQAGNRHTMIPYLEPDVWSLLEQLLTFCHVEWLWDGDYDVIDELIGRANAQLTMNIFVGSVVWRAGSVPSGMLLCDGTTYERVDYPDLYAALDAVYIVDADHFTVPDLIGNFVLGSTTIGDTGGAATHTLTTTEMPAHSHTNTPHSHTEIIAVAALINGGLEAPAAAAVPAAGVTGASGVVIDSTGGSGAHNNMPPYLELLPCIVAF